RHLHSFPTRRSSDLRLLPTQAALVKLCGHVEEENRAHAVVAEALPHLREEERGQAPRVSAESSCVPGLYGGSAHGSASPLRLCLDRKSTRLNSSHSQ